MASFVLPIISGLAGLFGGGTQKTTNTNQSGNQFTASSGTSTGSTSPVLSDLQQKLSSLFGAGAQNLYNNDANLSGYTTAGLSGIAGQGNLNNKAISNSLAARGLSFSPAASTALTQNTINTGNQQQQFMQQIPLLQRQLKQQDVTGLEGAFAALPTGTTSTGSTTGTSAGSFNGQSTSTTSGNPMAGLFSGLGAGLAGPGQNGFSNISSILQMLGWGSTPTYGGGTNIYGSNGSILPGG